MVTQPTFEYTDPDITSEVCDDCKVLNGSKELCVVLMHRELYAV